MSRRKRRVEEREDLVISCRGLVPCGHRGLVRCEHLEHATSPVKTSVEVVMISSVC